MRPSLETSAYRVVVLASGLALFAGACGGSSGKPSGMGGSSADAGSDAKGTGGAGGAKVDSGTDTGAGGRVDSGTDSGAGGRVDSGTDGGDAGTGGAQLVPPWHAYLPLTTASTTSGMGTTPDISGNHYDGTYYGAATTTFANGFVNLTGVPAEEVVVTSKGGVPAVDVTGSYSVQAWVKLANLNAFQTVVSGEGFNIASFFLQKRIDLGGAWFFTTPASDAISAPACISPPLQPIDGGPAQNPVVVVANTVYHLVATRDGTTGTQILYVNGAESGRNTCAGGFADTGILGIGHGVFNGGRTDFVTGSISDVGVINRVLTPTEVLNLYNKGRTFVPPPPPDAGPDLVPDAGPDTAPDAPNDTPDTDGSTGG
jgi:concanavalin A-like lectin/glucanase superfamily protein